MGSWNPKGDSAQVTGSRGRPRSHRGTIQAPCTSSCSVCRQEGFAKHLCQAPFQVLERQWHQANTRFSSLELMERGVYRVPYREARGAIRAVREGFSEEVMC